MTTTAKVRCTRTETDHTNFFESFGVCDERGREVGARAYCYFLVRTADEAAQSFSIPGEHYVARVQMTRGGQDFGAWQEDRAFSTAPERDAWVAAQMAASRKRAVKKYA